MADIHQRVSFRPHMGGDGDNILLATNARERHINIYLSDGSGHSASICAHPEDAKSLRDALIEAYPLDTQTEAQRYEAVGQNVVVHKPKPGTITVHYCAARSEQDAERIANSLNMTEL